MKAAIAQSRSSWRFNRNFPKGFFKENQVLELPHQDAAVIFYSRDEVHMTHYYACISIFTDRIRPVPIFDREPPLQVYSSSQPLSYGASSDERFLFFSKELLSSAQSSDFSWVILDLQERRFAFVPMANALDYVIEEISPKLFYLKAWQIRPQFPNRNGESIHLEKLTWFDEVDFGELEKRYLSMVGSKSELKT